MRYPARRKGNDRVLLSLRRPLHVVESSIDARRPAEARARRRRLRRSRDDPDRDMWRGRWTPQRTSAGGSTRRAADRWPRRGISAPARPESRAHGRRSEKHLSGFRRGVRADDAGRRAIEETEAVMAPSHRPAMQLQFGISIASLSHLTDTSAYNRPGFDATRDFVRSQ